MASSKTGGQRDSATALTPLPSLKHDTSSEPRMLTPSEQDWLRANKRVATTVMLDVIAAKKQGQAARTGTV